MQALSTIGFSLIVALLLFVAAIRVRRSEVSLFELERRVEAGDTSSKEELARALMLDDLVSVIKVAERVLVIVMAGTAVLAFGTVTGLLIALGVGVFYGRLANFEQLNTWITKMYEQLEPGFLRFIERHPSLVKVISSTRNEFSDVSVSSREELLNLIEHSGHLITPDERRLIINGIKFSEKTVESIMTPRGVVESISQPELIGPLALDELHRTGHSRFPVIDGDIDHVVGVLHIKELIHVGTKDSETAGQVMEKRVFYINQDQTLEHALAAFLKTRHHLFVVVNGYRETAGLLTLEDCMEALIGRTIVDEYDLHDDLRAVAARSAKTNNNPPRATNV